MTLQCQPRWIYKVETGRIQTLFFGMGYYDRYVCPVENPTISNEVYLTVDLTTSSELNPLP